MLDFNDQCCWMWTKPDRPVSWDELYREMLSVHLTADVRLGLLHAGLWYERATHEPPAVGPFSGSRQRLFGLIQQLGSHGVRVGLHVSVADLLEPASRQALGELAAVAGFAPVHFYDDYETRLDSETDADWRIWGARNTAAVRAFWELTGQPQRVESSAVSTDVCPLMTMAGYTDEAWLNSRREIEMRWRLEYMGQPGLRRNIGWLSDRVPASPVERPISGMELEQAWALCCKHQAVVTIQRWPGTRFWEAREAGDIRRVRDWERLRRLAYEPEPAELAIDPAANMPDPPTGAYGWMLPPGLHKPLVAFECPFAAGGRLRAYAAAEQDGPGSIVSVEPGPGLAHVTWLPRLPIEGGQLVDAFGRTVQVSGGQVGVDRRLWFRTPVRGFDRGDFHWPRSVAIALR